jgi:non-ribosomal peptide synthase protein (TIGR01720 family)
MMEPIVGAFTEAAKSVTLAVPRLPIISNLTGTWLSAEQATDPSYWGTHLRRAVRFSDGIKQLLNDPDRFCLEVGPGKVLASLARQHLAKTSQQFVAATTRHPNERRADEAVLLDAVGRLWLAGVEVNWEKLAGHPGRRVALPTYPFERKRYWMEVREARPAEPIREVEPGEPELPPVEPRRIESTEAGGVLTREEVQTTESRRQRLVSEILATLSELSGSRTTEIATNETFLDLGFDSLLLTQANSQFRRKFGVRITFRHLFEKTPTIDSLAAHLDEELPAEAFRPVVAVPSANAGSGSLSTSKEGVASELVGQLARVKSISTELAERGLIERMLGEQLKLLETQFNLLIQAGGANVQPAPVSEIPAQNRSPLPVSDQGTDAAEAAPKPAPSSRSARAALTERQQRGLEELVARYGATTRKSKELAQQWRPYVADNRTIVGFDRVWKELVYQIVSVRSAGSRIWDVDGNEYLDTALCLGANLLGHSPECVVNAVKDQLTRGYEVAVQNCLLGEVSEMVCRMTQNERLTYCYSGSEAVETAIRIARASTGRNLVAYFTRDIHGRSDVVLGRPVNVGGRYRTVPQVAGIPQQVVDNALVLEYGTQEAYGILRDRASELALVLIEPVRTRNPDLQPIEFLKQVRRLADEAGFLVVFDEIVTGFRAHPGGVQALFGVRSDLTTYGKVLGGGMPIGVVAGRAKFIDLIDGGQWRFGDDSYPEADITASGGTMIKHPVALAAARAVLGHLQDAGPALQEKLTEQTSQIASELNEHYRKKGLPIHIEHFSSFFRPNFTGNRRFEGLFQYYLRSEGVHTNPPSPSFLSTAHTDEDLAKILEAYQSAAERLAAAGFLEETPSVSRAGSGQSPTTGGDEQERKVPMLPNVTRFLVERDSPEPHQWNLAVLLEATEDLRPGMVHQALVHLVARHDSLRLRFRKTTSGWQSVIVPAGTDVPFSSYDLSGVPVADQASAIQEMSDKLQVSLDLSEGPLLRVAHFDLGSSRHRLLVVIHHFAIDGLSWRPFWEDFQTAYASLCQGRAVAYPKLSASFEQWAVTVDKFAKSERAMADLELWKTLPWDRVKRLPLDFPGAEGNNTNASARSVSVEFTVAETSRFLNTVVPQKVDLLYAALAECLGEWTQSDTVLFEVMGHGREENMFDGIDLLDTVGFFISYTPLVLKLTKPAIAEHGRRHSLSEQIQPLMKGGLTFDLLRFLSGDDRVRETLRSLPRAEVVFNFMGRRTRLDAEPVGSKWRLASEPTGRTHSPKGIRYYPLAISSEVWNDRLKLNFVYSENLHARATIERLAARYRSLLLESLETEPESTDVVHV